MWLPRFLRRDSTPDPEQCAKEERDPQLDEARRDLRDLEVRKRRILQLEQQVMRGSDRS
jgi:hypothetical protein